MLGAQPDDPARQAGVSAHRLNNSYSRHSAPIIRFAHQSQPARLLAVFIVDAADEHLTIPDPR